MAATAVITQPTYLPWLGYFEAIAHADVAILLDTVQFVQRSWHSRNRLRTPGGQVFWLTIPVAAHTRSTALKDIRVSASHPAWRDKHLRAIRSALGSAPFFDKLFPRVEEWLRREHVMLADLTHEGIATLCEMLRVDTPILRASQFDVEGVRTERLVNLCRAVGATRYLSAAGSKVYLDEESHLFDAAGIAVSYQDFHHPQYPQRGADFVSHLSALDALMNAGPDATRAMIGHAASSRSPMA